MKINEAKLKVGMVVRTDGSLTSGITDFFDGVICGINESGFSVKQFGVEAGGKTLRGLGKYCEEIGKDSWLIYWNNFGAEIEILNDGKPQAIVRVPTEDDWIRVMKVALDNGWKWSSGNEGINEIWWNSYKENSCLVILDERGIYYDGQNEEPYKSKYAFITADEFVRDWGVVKDNPVNNSGLYSIKMGWKRSEEKQKTKTMKITTIVKQILDPDIRKLVKADYLNGDLALTEEGVTELLGLVFTDKKAELVKLAEEKLEEAK